MMDVVVFNDGEYSAKVTNNTSLPAVMDIAAADNVASDSFLCPAFNLGLADVVAFRLGSVLELEF